jgi:spermidine dehydrogenase
MTRGGRRELGMGRDITRRDFLNGVGVALTGAALAPDGWNDPAQPPRPAVQETYYPPTRTGLRGSHPGSFEVAHRLRDGASFGTPERTGEHYDLVVVGAGLSGLSSAYFFRSSAGPGTRTLVLDNHDDFGGHAKRNEFHFDGSTLLLNGGTSNIESVERYSTVASALLQEVGIDWRRAYEYDQSSRRFYESWGLGGATFFARETFGTDRLVMGSPGRDPGRMRAWLAGTPLARQAQRDLVRLYAEGLLVPELEGLPDWEKKERLAKMSYARFLEDAGIHRDVLAYLDDRPKGLFCVGIDAYPALYAWAEGEPGFQRLQLEPFSSVGPLLHIGGGQHGRENGRGGGPTFNLPDGNATIARLLVRQMIPEALPGSTLEDSVMARLDYGRLDRTGQPVRIRLNSTVVRVEHVGTVDSASTVDVTYVERGRARTVTAAHVVLACWHPVIPYICPELSPEQREALRYGEKMPIVYTSVAIGNWEPFAQLAVRSVTCPGMYHTGFSLGRAIEIGAYRPPRSPRDPTVLHMTRTPCDPGKPKMEQHRQGRRDLLATSFETFELKIRDQLARGLAGTDFDPARDIVAIAVNRWPHGYAYSYNTLEEPIEWALFPSDDRPCVLARRRFGRVSIANSDAAATPHTDAAIDEGHRAVQEQLEVRSRARRQTSPRGAQSASPAGRR